MEPSPLNAAIHAIKSGDKAGGLRLLTELVKSEPNNELAWLWLSVCFEDPQKKKFCLNRTLTINPANQSARRALEQMERPVAAPPANAATAPRPPVANPASSATAIQAATSPAVTVSETPASSAEPPKSTTKKKRKSRWPLYLLLVILILLVCLGGGFFASQRLYALLNNQISGQFGNVYQALVTQSGPATENFSQIGVFLLEGSDTQALERSIEAPAFDLPTTQSIRPSLILNDPQIYLPELVFATVDGSTILQQIPLKNEEYLGAVLATPEQNLLNGVYCLIQYSSSTAPGQEPRWCFQVGQPSNSSASGIDPFTLNVAPPGDGFFLLEQGQAVRLVDIGDGSEDLAKLTATPVTTNRRAIVIVQSANVDLSAIQWEETFWGSGIAALYPADSASSGSEIVHITDPSPAAQSGPKLHDFLMTIDGQPLATGYNGRKENYNRLLGAPGSIMEITVRQGTQIQNFQLPRTVIADRRNIEYQIVQKAGFVYLVPAGDLRPGIYCLHYGGKERLCFQIQ
jgi:hypothetical protein